MSDKNKIKAPAAASAEEESRSSLKDAGGEDLVLEFYFPPGKYQVVYPLTMPYLRYLVDKTPGAYMRLVPRSQAQPGPPGPLPEESCGVWC